MEKQVDDSTQTSEAPADNGAKAKRGCAALILPLGLLLLAWILIRPGVFTVQPIGALPEGVTIIYHSRGPEMPLFSSPDRLCLEIQDSVSLLCRALALGAAEEIVDRVIVRLPYSHWAYLKSTGGLEFEQ